MINAYWESLSFALPDLPDGCGPWRQLIDTFQDAPSDFLEQEVETQHHTAYTVQSRSIVLMTTGRCGEVTEDKDEQRALSHGDPFTFMVSWKRNLGLRLATPER